MGAFQCTTTTVPAGTSLSALLTAVETAMSAAGYLPSSVYVSGTTKIYAYNVPIPNGTRTATLLLKTDTANVLLATQICDSTQYNSATGVVTNGFGWQSTNMTIVSQTTSTAIQLYSFKSTDNNNTPNNRFNFVIFYTYGGNGPMRIGMMLPYKITTLNYLGSYDDATHTLAFLLDPNPSSSTAHYVGGILCPSTFNPFFNSTNPSNLSVTNSHLPIPRSSEIILQLNPSIILTSSLGNFPNTYFAHMGADFAHSSANNVGLFVYSKDLKWQCIGFTNSGAIFVRVA